MASDAPADAPPDVPAGPRLHLTRQQIVAAADQVICDRGLVAATTKAIAEKAGCAEGSIYRYFQDKHALYHEVVRARFPIFLEIMTVLPARAGKGSVRRNLEEVATAALTFYRAILPLVGGAIGNRQLLEEQRKHFHDQEVGPMHAIGRLSTYLKKEQALGRMFDRVSADHVSRLLLGACFAQAYLELLVGDGATPRTNEQFAKETVRTLMEGIQPRGSQPRRTG